MIKLSIGRYSKYIQGGIVNTYTLNIRAYKFIKQTLREKYIAIQLLIDFNTLFYNKSSREKINKKTAELNNTIEQIQIESYTELSTQ